MSPSPLSSTKCPHASAATVSWFLYFISAVVCLSVAWFGLDENLRQYLDNVRLMRVHAVPQWWISTFITYGNPSCRRSITCGSSISATSPPSTQRPQRSADRIKSKRHATMEWWIILSIGLVALLLSLFMSGLPIYSASWSSTLSGAADVRPGRIGMFINSIFESTSSEIAHRCRAVHRDGRVSLPLGCDRNVAFRSCDTLIGKVRGRQYYLCISAHHVHRCAGGSAMGVAAMLGRSLYPAMMTRATTRSSRSARSWPRGVAGADHSALGRCHHYWHAAPTPRSRHC